jgi:hypothetical protein
MLAPGVSNNNSQLQQRISMILNTRRNSSPGLAKGPLATILTATGLVVTLGLCSGPRLVLAGPPPAATTRVTPSGEPDLVPVSPAAPASGSVPAAPTKTPKVSDRSDPDKNADGSIEDRLGRLEKLVRELLEQQGQKHSPGTSYFKDGGDNLAMAERQAARAAEQAQRAAEQAKLLRELDEMRQQDQQHKADLRKAFERHAEQLEALRKAREDLGQELERLNRQIEKLEKEQQHSESESPRPRSDAGGAKLAPSTEPTEPARP